MTDKTGRQVYTRITKVIPFTQEYQDATWQKEGWVKSVTDKLVGNYPYAIEFEVVNKSTQPSTQINFEENLVAGYPARTRINASADATIHLGDNFETPGEKLTKKSVKEQGKVYRTIETNNIPFNAISKDSISKAIENIVKALNAVNAKSLNIAGNGIYDMKGRTQEEVDEFTYTILSGIVNSPDLKNKITLIRSGGQTGFDEAGAKAGIRLGIPTTVLAPKDYEFRTNEGNVKSEQAFKARFGNQPSTQPIGVKSNLFEQLDFSADEKQNILVNFTNKYFPGKSTAETLDYINEALAKADEQQQKEIVEKLKTCYK
jgi:hypothetical protein